MKESELARAQEQGGALHALPNVLDADTIVLLLFVELVHNEGQLGCVMWHGARRRTPRMAGMGLITSSTSKSS